MTCSILIAGNRYDSQISFFQRSKQWLAPAYDALVERFSCALGLHDGETQGHSRRVTEMTIQLARAMGMSEVEIIQVRRGALLHDVGKLRIPDHILLKPGPLNEEEWAIMRRHPTYACEMLAPILFLRPALDIPRAHHEKWNGTGYPSGLRGEAIPLAARIVAVVDVWDALTSDRPYRKAWSHERARAYIQEQAGIHFDPRVVNSFLAIAVAAQPVTGSEAGRTARYHRGAVSGDAIGTLAGNNPPLVSGVTRIRRGAGATSTAAYALAG